MLSNSSRWKISSRNTVIRAYAATNAADRSKGRGSNRNGSFNFRLARSSLSIRVGVAPRAGGIVRPLNGVDIIRIIAGHAPLIVRHSSAAVRNVPRYQPRWYKRMAINRLARWLMGQEDNCGCTGILAETEHSCRWRAISTGENHVFLPTFVPSLPPSRPFEKSWHTLTGL